MFGSTSLCFLVHVLSSIILQELKHKDHSRRFHVCRWSHINKRLFSFIGQNLSGRPSPHFPPEPHPDPSQRKWSRTSSPRPASKTVLLFEPNWMDSERTQIISDRKIISTFQHMIRLLFLLGYDLVPFSPWFGCLKGAYWLPAAAQPPMFPTAPASEVAGRSLTATTAAASRGSGRSSPRARFRREHLRIFADAWEKRQEIRGNGWENSDIMNKLDLKCSKPLSGWFWAILGGQLGYRKHMNNRI